ncbi:c-type cytochrome [Azospirillum sp. SYSU D00513]|uniref:c-type cytochrome n=1 Tax=Azospirillum sp. SYSU D00513 TaxID=2812561 RepID=UPI001A96A529|nr:c-type cytochrome [Azospirillum sp. SYSU D00513]
MRDVLGRGMRVALAAAAVLLALPGDPAGAAGDAERGGYLVNGIVGCGNCHTLPPGPDGGAPGPELAGGPPMAEVMFTAHAPNLTPDPETGLGRWTDEQIIRAIREGKRPDGSTIGPPMPFQFYAGLSDRDARDIVAYLRGLTPVRNETPASSYKFPLPPAWGPPVTSVAEVPRTDKVAYGAYMAHALGHCMECHSPLLPTGLRDLSRMGVGGQQFAGPWGVTVARNITQDKEQGIGAWTDGEIKAAITQGVRPDGSRLGPPMAFHYYRNIAAEDLDALVAYLRTVPPLR